MKYRLASKSLSEITTVERKRLNYLTIKCSIFSNECSMMRRDILHRKGALNKVRVVMTRDEAGTVVAWSSILLRPKKLALIYTYVMRDHRRKGLGSRLINCAIKWCKQQDYTAQVFAWDKQSTDFFERTAKNIEVVVT